MQCRPSRQLFILIDWFRIAAQGLSYQKTESDEVEDMLQLIAYAKQRHPELEAVSSGAIASDYQRLRVEHVSASSAARADESDEIAWQADVCFLQRLCAEENARPGIGAF